MARKGKPFEIPFPLFGKVFYETLAGVAVNEYRKITFDKSNPKMANKQPFPKYTSKSYQNRKQTNKLKRQASEFANSTAPVLSSDLLRDWKLRKVTNNGFSFGTTAFGDRVEHLAKMGRVISKDGKELPKDVERFLMHEADKYVQKKLDKTKGGTFNI